MSWLDDKFSNSESLAWGSAVLGFSVFAPSFYLLNRSVNNAVCNNINEACGTSFSSNQCNQFKSEYLRNANGEHTLKSISSDIKRFLRNPIDSFRAFGKSWRDVFQGLKTLDPKTVAPLISQEASYFVGASAFQFDLAFLAEHLGGSFWATLPFSIGLCWASTMARRAYIIGSVSRQMKHFGYPSKEVCESAKGFEAKPSLSEGKSPSVENMTRSMLEYSKSLDSQPVFKFNEINLRDYIPASHININQRGFILTNPQGITAVAGAGIFSKIYELLLMPARLAPVFIILPPNFEDILKKTKNSKDYYSYI